MRRRKAATQTRRNDRTGKGRAINYASRIVRQGSTLNGQHPEMQLAELREYASRRGWEIAGEYVDEGVSGSKESRPELNRLMGDSHRRQFDIVLVWKIDRFGRSLKHLVNALADLDSYGVTFASLKDNLDLSTPSGRSDVPNHRGNGGIREGANPGEGEGRTPKRPAQREAAWPSLAVSWTLTASPA